MMTVKGPIRRQILSCISGNLLTLAHGSTNAWSTANFLPLQKSDTLLPSGALSLHEAALVMSIYYIGAIVGNLTIPHVVQKYGCKSVLLVGAFPQIIICLLIIFAQNPYYLYATSILGGFTGVFSGICMPVFVCEISDDKIRGTLNAFYGPAFNSGCVITFLLANHFNYVDQAKILMILPVVFFALFAGIPETPQHLINAKKPEAANRAHKFFRGTEVEIPGTNDTKDISDQNNTKLKLSDFTNRYARKAYFIAFSLMLLGPLQGMTILTTYVAEIFASTNPNNSPLYASTMITSIMIIAHLIYLNVVDRAGRRKFYICSSLATSAGLTLFAFYLYFLTDNLAFDWVPIVCLSYVLFANSLGMATIPWLIIIETMPKKIKQYGYANAALLTLINTLILIEMYPLLKIYIGLLGWVIIFASTTFLSAVFGYFVLPETRGKSHEEIMELL